MAKQDIPMALEIDAVTGEHVIRQLTADEITQREIDAANNAAKIAATNADAEKREAVLASLALAAGLSVDDVKSALGA